MFEDLKSKSKALDALKNDIVAKNDGVSVERDKKQILITIEGTVLDQNVQAKDTFNLSDKGLADLLSKLGNRHYGRPKSLPADYIERLDEDVFKTVMDRHLAKTPSKWMYRINGGSVRAVLSGDYPRLWNTEIIEAMQMLIDEMISSGQYAGVEQSRSFVTADDLGMYFFFPTGAGDRRIGCFIRHAENGTAALEGRGMVQTTRCTNSIVSQESIRIVHYRGQSPASMMNVLHASMPSMINASAKMINRLTEASSIRIDGFSTVIEGVALEYGLKHHQKDLIHAGAEGSQTLTGLVDGITYMSQQIDDDLTAYNMNVYAGQLLNDRGIEVARLLKQGDKGRKAR